MTFNELEVTFKLTIFISASGVTQWPLGPLRSPHMNYRGNGIQNWFLKETRLISIVSKPIKLICGQTNFGKKVVQMNLSKKKYTKISV